jgi:hypothetical protein
MKHLASNNFIGRRYTFYLSNYNLPNDSFFHYQIYSPGLTYDFDPVFSLKKLGERTKVGQSFDQERDILSFVLGGKENIDQRGIEWLKGAIRNDDVQIQNEGSKFPRIQMSSDRGVQKNVICSLRDSIRRKNYRFFPGRKVDILWTPDEFVVFEFKGDDRMTWLEPVGVYKTTDYLMIEPLPVDLGIINCESLKWEKGKIMEIGQTIRRLEWNSFDSRFRFVK